MDASPYLSGAYEARKLLERLPGTLPLRELTTGHDGGIFNGPQFSRLYTNDPEYGVPFLGSTDMLEADFTNLPLLHKKVAKQLAYLEVKPGMTMITCSGTIGRTAYVRSGHGRILVIAAHDEGESRSGSRAARLPVRVPAEQVWHPDYRQRRLRRDRPAH